jgi:hypothetical protein
MSILRHLYLSTALRSPDEPAAPEPEVVEPVAEVVPEPVAEIVPEPEPVVEAVKPESLHGNKGQTPWFQRVIAEVRQEKQQERTAREAAEQRAADLQAIIERMQTDPNAAPPAAKTTERAAPADKNRQDIETLARAFAESTLFNADCSAVADRWKAESAEGFKQGLDVLGAIGLMPREDGNTEFMQDVLAVDKAGAHKILDKLAKDPEKAASLVGMDSRRRIAELTRMADAPKTEVKPAVEAPKPAAVSRAPTPAPRLAPLAAAPDVDPTTPDGNDKLDGEAWNKWYASKYLKKA